MIDRNNSGTTVRITGDRYDPLFWRIMPYLVLPLAVPYAAIRMIFNGRYRSGFRQRLTAYTAAEAESLGRGDFLWLHASSMGEVQAATPLIDALRESRPGMRLLVSAFTDTGYELARRLDSVDAAIYLPLDLGVLCGRAMQLIRPSALIVFETELWPNLIRHAAMKRVPLLLVNGRLSDRSYPNYRRFRSLFQPLLAAFDLVLAQSDIDGERFRELGALADRVRVPGNIKFAAVTPRDDAGMRDHWRHLLRIGDEELLIVAGSTFSGEETMLARNRERLAVQGLAVKLLIAPRHVERTGEILRQLEGMGATVARKSAGGLFTERTAVVLLDTVGELRDAYAAADLVFMGKSLGAVRGGQNPLEPAAWRRAILSGSRTHNFRDIYAMLEREGGVEIVRGEDDLYRAALQLLVDNERRATLGKNACSLLARNGDVLGRILTELEPWLDGIRKRQASNEREPV